jgi:hypothetical protein
LSVLIYLVGEGQNDIGDLALEPVYQRGREGFLQPIIRRVVSDARIDGTKITALGKERVSGVRDALGRKAAQAVALARYFAADALVFVTDLDKSRKSKDVRTEYRSKVDAITTGFTGAEIPCIAGVPARTVEAWVLGDLGALSRVLRSGPPQIPRSPEELWGEPHNPRSNHPKMVLQRCCGGDIPGDLYSEVASVADLDVLERECPVSFAPFVSELRAL